MRRLCISLAILLSLVIATVTQAGTVQKFSDTGKSKSPVISKNEKVVKKKSVIKKETRPKAKSPKESVESSKRYPNGVYGIKKLNVAPLNPQFNGDWNWSELQRINEWSDQDRDAARQMINDLPKARNEGKAKMVFVKPELDDHGVPFLRWRHFSFKGKGGKYVSVDNSAPLWPFSGPKDPGEPTWQLTLPSGRIAEFVWSCGNVGDLIEKPRIPQAPPEIGKPPIISPPGAPPILPGTSTKQQRDTWDLYLGAGNYRSVHQGGDNHGYYGWTKARYRPFWFDPCDSNLSIGVGAFGFLAGGRGIADRDFKYTWKEAVLGGTAKVLAEHRDFDIDIGAGSLWNSGKWQGVEVNRQYDGIFLVSAHANLYKRRDTGEKWFPKAEINIEGRFPFSTSLKMGQKTDNRFLGGMLTQWLYDFQPYGDKSLNIAPGVNLGGGYEWARPKDKGFAFFGPAVEFSSYDNVIGALSIWNYKTGLGGQWHPISGYISVDGIYDAWKASHITALASGDLQSPAPVGGSKLLYNPADFLK